MSTADGAKARPPRRVPSVRITLILATAAAFGSVAFVGLALTLRMVPSATEVARRGTGNLDGFTLRSQALAQLDSTQTELMAASRAARQRPVPPGALRVQRARLERILRNVAGVAPSLPGESRSARFSDGLQVADAAASDLAGTLLGALAAIEIGDLDAADALLITADSLDAPLSQSLSDIIAFAIAELDAAEAQLASDARFANRLIIVWLALGVALSAALWWVLARRLFQPLKALDHALARLECGEFDVALAVPLDDEMGRLSSHFNRAAEGIRTARSAASHAAAERALAESEARHRLAFEEAAVGLAELGLDGTYLRINRATSTVLGRPEHAIIGRCFLDFLEPEAAETARAQWRRFIGDAAGALRTERIFVRGDGNTAITEVTATLLRDAHGAPHHVLSVVQDLTEQRRLQHESLQSMKLEAVGQLAGGVAHDFNNLLSGIIGYAELLEHDTTLEAEVRNDARAIRRTAERGADLSRSLLTLARRNPHRAAPFDLEEMLRETVELVRRTIDRRVSVTLSVHDRITIHGDRSLLSNALLNLALNARDAMPDGGTLAIEARLTTLPLQVREQHQLAHDGAFAEVTVRDTGCGMEPFVLEHLFEPFFTTKALGKGTGLGLAMVYGTVRDHRGIISAESTKGVGTTITIRIPCTAEAPSADPELPSSGREGPPVRVLVVDDDRLIRDVARRMLDRLGYDSVFAGDGVEAIDRLSAPDHGIDVVLLDGNMPRMNGIETARHLHASHPALPLIYASGFYDAAVVEDLVSLGIEDRLAKPYTMDALARVLARVTTGT